MTSSARDPDTAVAVLLDLHRRTSGTRDVQQVFDAVVTAVTEQLGFGAAALSVRLDPEGSELTVVATSGPESVRDALLGTQRSLDLWAQVIAQARPWGLLRFIDHAERTVFDELEDIWTPVALDSTHPQAWHPLDALFAVLDDSHGELLGVLSVDMPPGGLRPDAGQCDLLQLFAVTTAAAVEHARVARRLSSREAAFRSVVTHTPVGMALFDDRSLFCEVNSAFCDFLGRRAEDLIGTRVEHLVHPDDRAASHELGARVRAGAPGERTELRHLHADGRTVWGRVSLSRLEEPDGTYRVLAHVEDVTERRAAEEQLLFRAEHDELTGLPRRAVLLRGLQEALDTSDGTVAVLFADIDHFKLVNDSYGHAAGDQLLVHVGQMLTRATAGRHLVGRLSGDEFVLVLRDLTGVHEAVGIADRLRREVKAPVVVVGRTLTPSVSIGIAVGRRGSEASHLLANADAALYRAKARGRGRWAVYDDQLRAEAMAELALRSELSGALARGEFRLHYQPIVELGTEATLGYEALLRWQHPERGLLRPKDFLAALEDSDAEDRVAHWVLDQACADASGWQLHQGLHPFVSINMPSAQLSRPDLGRRVTGALRRHGLPADRLWIEVTEDRLVADPKQVEDLQRLRNEGVHVAIDDFGTGYAGLAYLQRLPADVVKLDKVFVQRIHDDEVTATIVRSVVELSQLLGLTVVGEGVETRAQADALRALGVGMAQGYLFSHPRALSPVLASDDTGGVVSDVVLPADAAEDPVQQLRQALETVTDPVGMAALFVAAARDQVGASAGCFAVPEADGMATTAYATGYPEALVESFRTFPLSASLPLSVAMSTGHPAYEEQHEPATPLHPALPGAARTVVTLAALPLHDGERLLGGLGVSWDAPVALPGEVRALLESLAAEVALRIAALRLPSPRRPPVVPGSLVG